MNRSQRRKARRAQQHTIQLGWQRARSAIDTIHPLIGRFVKYRRHGCGSIVWGRIVGVYQRGVDTGRSVGGVPWSLRHFDGTDVAFRLHLTKRYMKRVEHPVTLGAHRVLNDLSGAVYDTMVKGCTVTNYAAQQEEALRTLNDPHAQTQALLRGQARYERSLGKGDGQ